MEFLPVKIPIRGTVHGLISKTGNLRIPMCVVSSVGKKRDVATDFFRISIPGTGASTQRRHIQLPRQVFPPRTRKGSVEWNRVARKMKPGEEQGKIDKKYIYRRD